MTDIDLGCSPCDASHAADLSTLQCRTCGSPLDVRYRGRSRGDAMPVPLREIASLVSLGEGNTPAVPIPALGRMLGLRRLWAKLEFMNPTGSFKDRGTSVMVSVAREHGVTEIVEDSSGNAGASVAAYAVRAGIKAHIFAPASAPSGKVQQIRVYGAKAHLIEGTREDTTEATIAYHIERGLIYASHNLSPYFLEGTKSFAYEVANDFPDGLPDHIVMPVSNGSLFIGAWKGFLEMQAAGRISAIPRLHCAQARAAMPVVATYHDTAWSPEQGAKTVAGGISSASPPRMLQSVAVLKATGGVPVAVDDADILRWQRLLAETEGLYGEPTSAAAFAGLEELVKLGEIDKDDTVLVPITGMGLKDVPPD
jgi:threonine synthase